MRKLLILTTGGTIASAEGKNGLRPGLNAAGIMSYISGMTGIYDISVKDILNLDSSNIQPEEWTKIAEEVYAAYRAVDGIVITHGTDTMAYTSSMLSFMLQNIPIPVVLTGSQLPITHPLTDAVDNLRCALAMAASGYPGIYVAFDRKIMRGSRAVKVRTRGFDAFESINAPCIGIIDSNGLDIREKLVRQPQGECVLNTKLSRKVFLLKLTPGLDPKIFEMLAGMDYRGIVVEAFGAGGLHFIHRDLIHELKKLNDRGITVVVSSQCLYEDSDLSVYEVGKKALSTGVIQSSDMTTEACVTKLMWILGQTGDQHEIKRLFEEDLAGERSEPVG